MTLNTSTLIDDCMTLVTDCENRSENLNEWERDQFIPSIKARLGRNIALTDTQIGVLDSIWKRVTRKGGYLCITLKHIRWYGLKAGPGQRTGSAHASR